MYRDLGLADVGALLSCGRDAPLARGFDARLTSRRSRTLLEGAPACEFESAFTNGEEP